MKKTIFKCLLASFALYSCSSADDIQMPTPPGTPNEAFYNTSFVNNQNPDQIETRLTKETPSAEFTLKVGPQKEAVTPEVMSGASVKALVKRYASFKKMPYFFTLPEDQYEVTATTIEPGQTSSTVKIEIKDYDNMPYGHYVVPVSVSIGGKVYTQMVSVFKDGEYVPLSEENPKVLPPGYPNVKQPMKMIAYVETNDWDIRNMGQLILKDSKKPVFDYVVLFAANMNYDAVKGKRYVAFNDKLQPIINNPDLYIKPLQDRGIKVIIDILPNHQGVGYENFQSYEDAKEFVMDMKEWTEKLGVDGWDIDEEYAGYGRVPSLRTHGTKSVFWFLQAFKDVMPDKMLTLYEYGLNLYGKDEYGKTANDYIDFAVSNYGASWESYNISLDKFAAYSVEANWGLSGLDYNARRNIEDGNAGLMFFSIHGTEIQSGSAVRALSEATKVFYGEDCVFSGKYYPGFRG